MSTRMHPEDLRAIIAAIQCLAGESPSEATINHSIIDASRILAELAKTAKPEAALEEPPTTPDWCMHIRRTCHEPRGARENQDQAWTRAEKAESERDRLRAELKDTNSAWDYNVRKWATAIGATWTTGPEAILAIDKAITRGAEAEARIKELEALASVEVQHRRQQRIAELEACLEGACESLELALSRLGCPTNGNDGGGGGKHDADSLGGIAVLEDARNLLRAKTTKLEPTPKSAANHWHDKFREAEASIKELEDELANKAFDASIILGDNQRQRIAELEAALTEAKAQERERIINILENKAPICFENATSGGMRISSLWLRAALDPK